LDFVSTHVYGDDRAQDVFGTDEKIPRSQMVCRAVKKVHDEVKASARPDLPIEWSEFNASYMNDPAITDSVFMGPWLADTIRQCDGMVDNLAYWTFSDVFDEQGVVTQPFYGGYGLLAAGGVPKPSFNAFEVLHHLGTERIVVDSDSALVTRRADGSLAIALWNYFPPGETGVAKQVTLRFEGITGKRGVTVQRSDSGNGSVWAAYEKMGKPRYPTQQQLAELRKAAELPAPEARTFDGSELKITLPPYGLALVEIR
jgi:xylan 1,4-beta-xylosidase